MRLLFLLLALFGAAEFALAQEVATYTVTFESTWSASTHPEAFPSNPHFSGLIGATHGESERLWETGQLASPGIQSMAETGSKVLLRQEMSQLGSIYTVLDGGGIARSPGSRSLTFGISREASFVTLVSMLAPSPDWFVGVSALDLAPGGEWVDDLTVELYVYDAGTDIGATYTAANAPADPHGPIARLEEAPFLVQGSVSPVGSFRFQLTIADGVDDAQEVPAPTLRLFPQPASSSATVSLVLPFERDVQATVHDMLGRVVWASSGHWAVRHELVVPVTSMAAGIYFVRVQSGDWSETRPLVVAR